MKTKLRRMLIRIAKDADIKDLTTPHALRHTFVSQLIMKGVDLPTVQKLMGHSDIQTTMIYSHLAPDHHGEIKAKGEVFDIPVPPCPANILSIVQFEFRLNHRKHQRLHRTDDPNIDVISSVDSRG